MKHHEEQVSQREEQERRLRSGRRAFGAGQLAVHAAFKAVLAEEQLNNNDYPATRTVTLPAVEIAEDTEAVISRFDRREQSHDSDKPKFQPKRFSLAIKAGDIQEKYADIRQPGNIDFVKAGEYSDEDYEEVAIIFQAVATDMEARADSE
ncbi:MAG TPA: hypothetical protein VF401_00240 [Candidatus Saccharimonadales bacterium]